MANTGKTANENVGRLEEYVLFRKVERDESNMAKVIAMVGKGGVGKTTLCGLLIQYLCETGKGPVLAVDADANSNLNEVLGVKVNATLGQIREEMERGGGLPAGVQKSVWAEMRMNDALSEEDDFDLLVMGRTQGTGCYCFVNGLLQTQMQKLEKNYPYIVVDNEAGMEHISRGLVPNMNMTILVSDCSRRGVQAAGRIAELIRELGLKTDRIGLVINRAPNGVLNDGTREEIEKQDLELLGVVPQDETVYDYDCEGKPTVQLPSDSPVRKALGEILARLGL